MPKTTEQQSVVRDPLPGWLALMIAIAILLGVTIYPPMLVRRQGGADHVLLLGLCWAMSAGFVRGVGFVPRHRLPRTLLSGWALLLALLLSGVTWVSRV